MTYELAKQLKDAGFQQNQALEELGGNKKWVKEYKEWIDFPTLEELISAVVKLLPDNDIHLESMHGRWQAGNCYFGLEAKGNERWKDFEEWYQGSTPSEAVANLWLALNKQDA